MLQRLGCEHIKGVCGGGPSPPTTVVKLDFSVFKFQSIKAGM